MATSAKPAAKPADPAVPQNPKKKLFIIIGVVVAVALAGGLGWFFAKSKSDGHHEEVKVEPPKIPQFFAIENIVVNLRSEGADQVMQLGVSLKYFEPELDARIKLNLPEIRGRILQLLTTKTARELLTPEGKTRLVKEIVHISNTVLGIAEPVPPPALPAASQVAAAPAQEAHEGEAAPAPVPPPPPKPAAENKGIVDALFTSFIIQ
jgi:flagellar protein FliL